MNITEFNDKLINRLNRHLTKCPLRMELDKYVLSKDREIELKAIFNLKPNQAANIRFTAYEAPEDYLLNYTLKFKGNNQYGFKNHIKFELENSTNSISGYLEMLAVYFVDTYESWTLVSNGILSANIEPAFKLTNMLDITAIENIFKKRWEHSIIKHKNNIPKIRDLTKCKKYAHLFEGI